jgi:glycosyltransferase involved in cell wall biosynthesis
LKRFFQPKLKVVSFKHGYDEAFQKQNGFDHTKLKKDLFYRAMKWSSGVVDQSVAISEGLGSFLVKGGIVPDSKLEVIHYGFDYSHITIDPTYDQKYRYASNQLVIIGRLVTVKQHDKVIELLPDIHKVLPDLSLVIVGAGEKEEYLKQLVKQLQLTDIVHFEGFKTNTHDYIAASDIMLVPSSAEGFGAVILEGWNNKKPVIAFNVPAPNEIIIHEKNGLLIKPFDAQELKEGILRLLQDKSLTKQFGENGYQLLQEKFSLNAMISKTVRIYERVLTT